MSYAADGMRCTTCGTENTTDSRFCGGCGARLGASIPPGTSAQPYVPASPHAPTSVVPSLATPAPVTSIAPTVQRRASAPPVDDRSAPVARAPSTPPDTSGRRVSAASFSRAATPMPVAIGTPSAQRPAWSADGSLDESLRVPKRRWGLIFVVLLIDIAFAASGAVLLARGLATRPAAASGATGSSDKPAPPASSAQDHDPKSAAERAPLPPRAPVATTGAGSATPTTDGSASPTAGSASPTTAGSAIGDAAGSGSASATPTPTPISTNREPLAGSAAATPTPLPAKDKPKSPTKKPKHGTTEPDPSASRSPSVDALVDAGVARLRAEVRQCHIAAGAPRGTVLVAFNLFDDGKVSNVAAVENSTGSEQLARCITAAVAAMSVTPHRGGTQSFTRPFEFQ